MARTSVENNSASSSVIGGCHPSEEIAIHHVAAGNMQRSHISPEEYYKGRIQSGLLGKVEGDRRVTLTHPNTLQMAPHTFPLFYHQHHAHRAQMYYGVPRAQTARAQQQQQQQLHHQQSPLLAYYQYSGASSPSSVPTISPGPQPVTTGHTPHSSYHPCYGYINLEALEHRAPSAQMEWGVPPTSNARIPSSKATNAPSVSMLVPPTCAGSTEAFRGGKVSLRGNNVSSGEDDNTNSRGGNSSLGDRLSPLSTKAKAAGAVTTSTSKATIDRKRKLVNHVCQPTLATSLPTAGSSSSSSSSICALSSSLPSTPTSTTGAAVAVATAFRQVGGGTAAFTPPYPSAYRNRAVSRRPTSRRKTEHAHVDMKGSSAACTQLAQPGSPKASAVPQSTSHMTQVCTSSSSVLVQAPTPTQGKDSAQAPVLECSEAWTTASAEPHVTGPDVKLKTEKARSPFGASKDSGHGGLHLLVEAIDLNNSCTGAGGGAQGLSEGEEADCQMQQESNQGPPQVRCQSSVGPSSSSSVSTSSSSFATSVVKIEPKPQALPESVAAAIVATMALRSDPVSAKKRSASSDEGSLISGAQKVTVSDAGGGRSRGNSTGGQATQQPLAPLGRLWGAHLPVTSSAYTTTVHPRSAAAPGSMAAAVMTTVPSGGKMLVGRGNGLFPTMAHPIFSHLTGGFSSQEMLAKAGGNSLDQTGIALTAEQSVCREGGLGPWQVQGHCHKQGQGTLGWEAH
ncbi:unnamed protein product, partial [Choristocarpus tenellus]